VYFSFFLGLNFLKPIRYRTNARLDRSIRENLSISLSRELIADIALPTGENADEERRWSIDDGVFVFSPFCKRFTDAEAVIRRLYSVALKTVGVLLAVGRDSSISSIKS
jgi:hypothetical protein